MKSYQAGKFLFHNFFLIYCCVSVCARACAQMERQILMQNQMRERQMAMQIAWSREFLNYFGSFFAVATVGLTAGWDSNTSQRSDTNTHRFTFTQIHLCLVLLSFQLNIVFYLSSFFFRAIKRKNPGMLAPIIPLSFIFAYQMDSAYGTLIYRMRGKATHLQSSSS